MAMDMMVLQVLLCFAVLIAPGTAAGPQAGRASCDRYTDSALKAVCEQLQAGVSRKGDAAAGPQADTTVQGRVVSATHTTADGLKHQQHVESELSKLLRRFASGSLAGHDALAEVLSHAGHSHPWHNRHRKPDRSKEEEEEPSHEPWYYHDHEDDELSYQNPSPEHEPHQHKDRHDDLYEGYNGHNYPPPAPIVPLYTSGSIPYVFTGITPAAGKANATGDLTQGEDFTTWSE